MTQFTQDMRLIWRYAILYNLSPLWRFVSLSWLGLSVPALTLLFFISKASEAATSSLSFLEACFAVPALLVLFQFWLLLVHGSKRLNTLTNARLVPRFRQRCFQALFLGMGFMTVVSTAVFYRYYGQVSQSLVVSLVFVILVGGSANRGNAIISFVQIVAIALPLSSAHLPPWFMHYFWSDFLVWSAVPLLLALALLTAHIILPRSMDEKREVGSNRPAATLFVNGDKRMAGLASICRFCGQYARSLKRACDRRVPGALMMHACGPSIHWSGLLSAAMGVAAIMLPVVVLLFLKVDIHSDFLSKIGWLFLSLGIFPLQLGAIQTLRSAMYGRSGEQGLFRLAPVAPGAEDFNRVLGRKILHIGLRNWFFTSTMILALTVTTGVGVTGLLIQSALCSMSLPMLAKPLKNYAEAEIGREYAVLWFLFGLFLIAGIMLSLQKTGLIMLPICAITCASLAFVLISRRLKGMEKFPVAFPSGRLESPNMKEMVAEDSGH